MHSLSSGEPRFLTGETSLLGDYRPDEGLIDTIYGENLQDVQSAAHKLDHSSLPWRLSGGAAKSGAAGAV